MSYEQERAEAFQALLCRIAAATGIETVTAAELPARAAATRVLAVLHTGEPVQSPESWDVCVVLPELLAACPGVAAVILDPAESTRAAPAFGVDRLPALVVLRDGAYAGVIEGMRDWEPFVAELTRLKAASPQPPPVAGSNPSAPTSARPT
jgi:hydrogenase-1 operon protein HyaE